MTHKKNFGKSTGIFSPLGGPRNIDNSPQFGYKNYSNMLPDVYIGHPNRTERYVQYEAMDMDPEVNASLDIIADFCTQKAIDTKTSFIIDFNEEPTSSESKILLNQLKEWYNLNDFDKRITKLVRNVIKYGDQVFIRDPETFQLFWVDMSKVTKIVVNESQGKEPEEYFIKDVNPNFNNLTATKNANDSAYLKSPQTTGSSSGYAGVSNPYAGGNRFTTEVNEKGISAEHVVHLSLTSGLDVNWPFGVSVLENVFKVFKQKELLEDAIIIYRVQRAPERRVFYIDTGDMPSHAAMQFVERIKNEIHQRRIPTQTGGGQSIMDTTYNPISINEDYFFPQTATGRGSKVETLPGGENLGQIDDLKMFTNKLVRGLRVPSSYLPTGADDGTASFSDGKVTTALMQEFRFNNYCKELQQLIVSTLDREFKMFLAWRGFNLDNKLFNLKFSEPLNFAAYREIDLDQSRISNFSQIIGDPRVSKRFAMKKYLGLTEIEMKENERMWREENNNEASVPVAGSDLRNVGVTPGGMNNDLEGFDNLDLGDDTLPGLEEPGSDELSDTSPDLPGTPTSGITSAETIPDSNPNT